MHAVALIWQSFVVASAGFFGPFNGWNRALDLARWRGPAHQQVGWAAPAPRQGRRGFKKKAATVVDGGSEGKKRCQRSVF